MQPYAVDLSFIFQQQLMSSLEKRELQFSNVIDRGEALIAQHHPALKTIETHLQVCEKTNFNCNGIRVIMRRTSYYLNYVES